MSAPSSKDGLSKGLHSSSPRQLGGQHHRPGSGHRRDVLPSEDITTEMSSLCCGRSRSYLRQAILLEVAEVPQINLVWHALSALGILGMIHTQSHQLQLAVTIQPFLGCRYARTVFVKQLLDEEVQRWASKETFKAYDHMRTWQMLEENAEFVTCIRQDCGYGQLHAGGLEDPIVVCGSCGARTCFIHRHSVWHDGLTCSEYEDLIHLEGDDTEAHNELQTRFQVLSDVHALRHGSSDWTIEEIMSMRTIAETARSCPSCNAAVEQSGGCKHMIS
ncbi:hypothetical protein BBP40_000696 [Aspergillus hancockii]|nr:hypothetical protein BBP40_000696 [Aspergillus hancockii]